MSNSYVPDMAALAPGQNAKSSQVNERYDNVVAGFDKLPAPASGKKGFSEPCPVGTPTDNDHATTKQYVDDGLSSNASNLTAAQAAQTAAETAQTNAENAQAYSQEWANKAEDVLVSAAAGGDQIDDYSALHHANKASASASSAAASAAAAAGAVTYETLSANGDVGAGTAQVAKGDHNHAGVYEPADANILKAANIGVTVQAYDVDTAKTDVANLWGATQRGTVLTDNDASFDMNAAKDFICTPTGSSTITFTNILAGRSGNIDFTNNSNYLIAVAAHVQIPTSDLNRLSVTGTYNISYWSPDGTNVMLSVSEAATGGV